MTSPGLVERRLGVAAFEMLLRKQLWRNLTGAREHDAAIIEASMEAIKAAVLAEREACAALCDEEAGKYARQHHPELEAVADECGGKIRASGENG